MAITLPRMLNTFDPSIAVFNMYISAITAKDETKISKVKQFRKYIMGEQAEALTDTQKDLLGASTLDFTLNICMLIVTVICDRLKIRDLTVTAPNDDKEKGKAKQIAEILRMVWDYNRMDERSADNHYMSSRDGEAFVIMDYDNDRQRVNIHLHDLYDGDQGVYAVYSEDYSAPLYFVKRWKVAVSATNHDKRTVQRMNVYYKDRVEKWILDSKAVQSTTGGSWQPYAGDNDEIIVYTNEDGTTYRAAIAWWTDNVNATGNPLGFPVFHFKANVTGTASGRSDLADVVPGIQDGINTANAMLHAAEQLMGTPLMFIADDSAIDEDEPIELFPGSYVKLGAGGEVGSVAAADLQQLSNNLNDRLRRAALVSHIPPYNLITSGMIAAEGTQQQNEILLLSKVKRRMVNFGNRYEDMALMALKLIAVFGEELKGIITATEIDDLSISCEWYPAEIRNEQADAELALKFYTEMGLEPEDALIMAGKPIEQAREIARRAKLRALEGEISVLRQQQNDAASQLEQMGAQRRTMEEQVA